MSDSIQLGRAWSAKSVECTTKTRTALG